MSKFWIEDVVDCAGTRYWVLFTHGMFHAPTAVISDNTMKMIAERVLDVRIAEIENRNNLDLGQAVREYRNRNGVTQQEFADRAGISRNILSMIENDKGNPTERTRRGIMRALGLE